MSPDVLILIATGCLAVVALIAAVFSLRNLKEVRKSIAEPPAAASEPAPAVSKDATCIDVVSEPVLLEPIVDVEVTAQGSIIRSLPASNAQQELVPHHGQIARVVDGQVVVTPTRSQVATAIMGQPRVRFAVWATGIAYALRPESRDRIVGMMRRDYRERRRHREQAARTAIRTAHSPTTRADEGARQ
ncbi:MAG: hypothetical protein GX678_08085 [Actinomycetales bacterium]|nr:hypothetical protein [Actinomycetales bacterium]